MNRPPRRKRWSRRVSLLAAAVLAGGVLATGSGAGAQTDPGTHPTVGASATAFTPDEVIVRYRSGAAQADETRVQRATGTRSAGGLPGGYHLLHLSPGHSVEQTLAAVRAQPGVVDAVPNYRLHAADFIPNDPGFGGSGGWQRVQWNFSGPWSVNAPAAWDIARHNGGPGGRGVRVAVIDSGVAFENRGRFRRNPDLYAGGFVAPYDFLRRNRHPDDQENHGTFVAGTIAEKTNNRFAVTGLAYDVRIMPLRILDANGQGDGATLARAIRYAVIHHAQVINLSVELDGSDRRSVPALNSALRYANLHRVVVVAASGNLGRSSVSYPAAGPDVIAVGATTSHGCLAAYSNHGRGLALVAPGGGVDAALFDDPYDSGHCNPSVTGRNIVQETFARDPRRFRLIGMEGTSFAAPQVTAVVALLLATHRLGSQPTPASIAQRLEATARPLGPRARYGAGLLNAAAALGP